MELIYIEALIKLRLAIGILGEKEHYGWWQSSFFTQGSDAFLQPLFGRTQLLAQCNGVSQAAALVHDEHIGVGHVYHLFRLPEDVEQSIHTSLQNGKFANVIESKTKAIDYLRAHASNPDETSIGPTRIGGKDSLQDVNAWRMVSGLYLSAFEKSIQIYPYFVDQQ